LSDEIVAAKCEPGVVSKMTKMREDEIEIVIAQTG
jgi:hypothetical protein